MRIRQRKDTDRDFFVFLRDTKGTRRVSVGNFYADSAGEAIDMAKRMYHGLFAGMETNSWQVDANEIQVARRVVAKG